MMRVVVPLGWTLWGAIAVALLYFLVQSATQRESSPEVGQGFGVMVAVALLAIHAGVGLLFAWVIRRQSSVGLILLAILFAYPLAIAIARPLVMGYRSRQWEKESARVGDFPDTTLAPMATAIRADDVAALERLLGGKAPPTGKDRAGNDLLAYAVGLVRDRDRGVASVKALLDAGADVRGSRSGEGVDPVNLLAMSSYDSSREVIRMLLERGADPNAVDPRNGNTPLGNVPHNLELVRLLVERGADIDRVQSNGVTPVVGFIATTEWDTALYLIEKGARLDVKNSDGLSVDYYLESWRTSVYGAHPEGWEQVKRAIAARRR